MCVNWSSMFRESSPSMTDSPAGVDISQFLNRLYRSMPQKKINLPVNQ
jgi:hypothetical protein